MVDIVYKMILIYNMELASVKDVETTEDKELKTQHLKIKINTI